MSKLGEDSKPIYNESGKVMKGPKYFKPDLTKFVNYQGHKQRSSDKQLKKDNKINVDQLLRGVL